MGRSIALIDLGSNTARLVVYDTDDQGFMVEIDNVKRSLRLISYLNEAGEINAAGCKVALDCMRYFKEFCQTRNVDKVFGVATAAVRQATNGQHLLLQIEESTGIQFRLLSGEQEGYYGYLAVVNSMNLEHAITIDIGGGSTELTCIQNRIRIASISLPFGVISLTQKFFKSPSPDAVELEQMQTFLSQQFSRIPWIQQCRLPVVAMGGTARTVAKIHQKHVQYTLPSYHHYIVLPSEIERIYREIRQLPLEVRRQIPGLPRDRADVIVAGFAVFDTLLRVTEAKQFITSNKGLRDGVLFEYTLDVEGPPILPDVTAFSVDQFVKRYRVDRRHADHVCRLATLLFDECRAQNIIALSQGERKILHYASMLFDIGRSINIYDKEEHTYYLLSNVLLMGLTHHERLLIAMVASYKSQKLLQKQMAEHMDIVTKSDKQRIEILGTMLLVAQALDRSMTQQIRQISCKSKKDALVLTCYTENKNAFEFEFLRDSLEKFGKAIKRNVQYEVSQ